VAFRHFQAATKITSSNLLRPSFNNVTTPADGLCVSL